MRYFQPGIFRFLNDLAANNNREWFDANRERYIETIQEPALAFIADFAPRLEKISPHFRADAKVQGGSLFRIYRDTRFSADKTPYKTNTGVHFRHERYKDAHAPGYYVHIQPGECFMGVGLWRPETKVAHQIRRRIATNPAAWRKAAHGKRFADVYQLDGDTLKRPPKGFEPDDPLIDDLKRKDFIGSKRLTQRQVTSADFLDLVESDFRRATLFMEFLCAAVDVEF
ncbi:MAG: DUF2461 domain-containing protein [Acidimicrobiia bacterium]